MFETHPKDLRDLLREADEARVQLPDFQRSYVWSESDVKGLIASIARGFPVGALLTLGSGGEVRFKPRTLAGVEVQRAEPDLLLLDGQQRVTSLHGALWSKAPMRTKLKRDQRKGVDRYFYIDIQKSTQAGADLEEAIIAVRADRRQVEDFKVVRDLSTREAEFDAGCFPLNLAFDYQLHVWLTDWQKHWQARDVDVSDLQRRFFEEVLSPIQSYKMPEIRLSKGSSREAICLIFEKVNVGGKKLDAFELVTAVFAGHTDPIDLRRDWDADRKLGGRFDRILTGRDLKGHENRALSDLRSIDFLQAVSLVHTREQRHLAATTGNGNPPQISCKRDAILALPLDRFRALADKVEDGFRKAGRFLNENKILWSKDLPYPAQIVALATVHAVLGPAADTHAAKDKLAQWFWRTALAEDYGTSPETKLARDAEEVPRWITGGAPPERLALLSFNPLRLDTLRNRIAAAYKAIGALVLREGCRDFVTGAPADLYAFGADPMDIHHIFPRDWCRRHGISADRYDSIVNKTPLTASSNRMIGGAAPCDYLALVEGRQGLSAEAMDAVLRSHLIDPALLRVSSPTVADFDRFYEDRKARLATLAARVTGLAVEVPSPEVQATEVEFDLDDVEEAA